MRICRKLQVTHETTRNANKARKIATTSKETSLFAFAVLAPKVAIRKEFLEEKRKLEKRSNYKLMKSANFISLSFPLINNNCLFVCGFVFCLALLFGALFASRFAANS